MAGVQGQGERTIYYKPRAGEGAYSGPKSRRASQATQGVCTLGHTQGARWRYKNAGSRVHIRISPWRERDFLSKRVGVYANDCLFEEKAEAAALAMTGGQAPSKLPAQAVWLFIYRRLSTLYIPASAIFEASHPSICPSP